MNYFLYIFTAFAILVTSCSSPKPGRMHSLSQSKFREIAPHQIKKHVAEALPRRDWTSFIERTYRGASVDVIWVFGKDQSVQSWVVQKERWISLQGNMQLAALTIALQPDLKVLTMWPSEKDIINFCLEVIKLLRGGGGNLLMPSFSDTVDKIHLIDERLQIVPVDRTYLIIKPLCNSIKYLTGVNSKTIVFHYLGADGSIEEWRVSINKKSVEKVYFRTILKNASLKRWLPTG